jgi:hypothetical protein
VQYIRFEEDFVQELDVYVSHMTSWNHCHILSINVNFKIQNMEFTRLPHGIFA